MNTEARDPGATARHLIRSAATATLCTAQGDAGGWPYGSLVQVATDDAGAPLMLISGLAEHTKNILVDARVGLLFDGTAGYDEPLTGPRLSLLGQAVSTADPRHRERYLARFPGAALYAGFRDFAFYRVAPERGHLVAGFGRIDWVAAADLVLPATEAAAAAALEAGVLEHMNADHSDAVRLYAERLLGVPGEGATLVGFDAEGCDLRVGTGLFRLAFPRRAITAGGARGVMVELTQKARAAG
jgi:heme oxygenase (biliverdin-IX-beta and delta-forming)